MASEWKNGGGSRFLLLVLMVFVVIQKFSQEAPYYFLQDSQFTSAACNNLRKKQYLRCKQSFEFVFVAIDYLQ